MHNCCTAVYVLHSHCRNQNPLSLFQLVAGLIIQGLSQYIAVLIIQGFPLTAWSALLFKDFLSRHGWPYYSRTPSHGTVGLIIQGLPLTAQLALLFKDPLMTWLSLLFKDLLFKDSLSLHVVLIIQGLPLTTWLSLLFKDSLSRHGCPYYSRTSSRDMIVLIIQGLPLTTWLSLLFKDLSLTWLSLLYT